MRGLQYALDIMDKSFGIGIRKAKQQTEGLDSAVNQTNRSFANVSVQGKKNISGLDNTIRNLKRTIVGAFAVGAIVAFANEVTNITAQFEGFNNAIEFASGEQGAQNIQFLDDTINRLNLDMRSSYKGFQTLTGSMKGTKLEGQGLRDIFDGVATAASVMNLNSEQTEGAFLALSQMASKGKVQAEELRGQLGERIPGALGIAARAMGVNQQQFNKMLDSGQVYAEDFLPKFAKELKTTFQDGLGKSTQAMQAHINKKNNALLSLKRTIGESLNSDIKKFLNTGVGLMNWLRGIIPQLEPVKQAFYSFLEAFGPIIEAFRSVGDSAGGAGSVINSFVGILNAASVVASVFANGLAFLIENYRIFLPVIAAAVIGQKIYALWQVAAAANTSILTLATKGLNAAIKANPIGFIVGLIIALVGVIKHAWENVGWFRGAIMAAWEAIKGFALTIKNYVINRFKELLTGITGIGKAIALFFKGDWDEAWKTGKDAAKELMGGDSKKQLIDDLRNTGKKAGEAYHKGVNEVEGKMKQKEEQKAVFDPNSANQKFLAGSEQNKETNQNNQQTANTNTQVSGGSGGSKHTVFNIQSFVRDLHINTTNLKDNPADIKAQLEQIFGEIIADLNLRVDAAQ